MKQILLFLVYVSLTASVFAIEFTIAPLYYFDEVEDRGVPKNVFQNQLLKILQRDTADNEIKFKGAAAASYNPPQSVGDAIVFCRAEEADFLVYGYITQTEYTIQGDLRILDYERKEVIGNIYAMDNKDKRDDFINDLAGKLFRFVQERYNIKIIHDPPSFIHIQIPLGLGYWVPMNNDWAKILLGIARVDGGIRIIPNDRISIVSGKIYFLSVGLDLSYKLGKGRIYDAWDHCITISAPVMFHRKYNEQHESYTGFGILYSMDLLYIKNPYEDPVMEYYASLGIMACGGWKFRFRENMSLFVQTRMELLFYEKPIFNFTPIVGIILHPYTREVIKKW